jgi:hypothetical protein
VRDVEHPVVLSSYESQGGRRDSGEEDDADKAPNDIPVFDALCQETGKNEEVQIEGCM